MSDTRPSARSPERVGARRLRTTSLRRRLIISTLAAVLVVLGAAVAATDILVGAQLKASATAQLDDRAERARSIHDSGADPAAVVTAAQGGGTTAQLVASDGRTYGNVDLAAVPISPTPLQAAGSNSPPPTPPVPPNPPPLGSDKLTKTIELSDGSLLTVAVDTAAISDVQNQLRSILIAVFAAAIALVGVSVVLIVRRSLKPLDHVTTLARRIASGNRGERLDPDRTDTEIGRAASAFDTMLDSVEAAETKERAASARTRQFFDDAAHELRTPIAGVQSAAETLIRTGSDASLDVREELEVLLVRESRRAARLVDDLLSLARIDEGIVIDHRPSSSRSARPHRGRRRTTRFGRTRSERRDDRSSRNLDRRRSAETRSDTCQSNQQRRCLLASERTYIDHGDRGPQLRQCFGTRPRHRRTPRGSGSNFRASRSFGPCQSDR